MVTLISSFCKSKPKKSVRQIPGSKSQTSLISHQLNAREIDSLIKASVHDVCRFNSTMHGSTRTFNPSMVREVKGKTTGCPHGCRGLGIRVLLSVIIIVVSTVRVSVDSTIYPKSTRNYSYPLAYACNNITNKYTVGCQMSLYDPFLPYPLPPPL